LRYVKYAICAVFYVMGALLLIFAMWSFTQSRGVISDAIEAGIISFSDDRFDIISFYMNSAGQHFVSAMLLIGIGVTTHILLYKKNEIVKPVSAEEIIREMTKSKNDKELDDWFEEAMDNEKEEAN